MSIPTQFKPKDEETPVTEAPPEPETKAPEGDTTPPEGDEPKDEEPSDETPAEPEGEEPPVEGDQPPVDEGDDQGMDPMAEHTHKLARVTTLLGGLAKVVHTHMMNPPVPPTPPEPMKAKQVSALQNIIEGVTWGRIPRQAAIAMIVKAFPQITPDEATAMVSPDGIKALNAEEEIETGQDDGHDDDEGDEEPDTKAKFDALDEVIVLDAAIAKLEAERRDLDNQIAGVQLALDYSDDQPRDEGGRFAAAGGGAGSAAHKVAHELLHQSGGDIHAALAPFHGEHVPETLHGEHDEVPTAEVHAALKSYHPSPVSTEGREMVTVHHSTTPEVAALLTKQGVIPEAKPVTLARERFENGEQATFSPGAGLSGGTYVGAPGTTGGFGRATVEMKVPKEWLSVPPELHGIETDPMKALHTEHGALITRPVPPSLIRNLDDVKHEAELTKGNIGIPREKMPQIAEKDVPEFIDHLRGRGIEVNPHQSAIVSDLKPTQSTMNMEKVRGMAAKMPPAILAKPVITSNDNHILDGHHRWAALKINNPQATIAIHRVNAPIHQLVTEAIAFPKSGRRTVKDASEDEERDDYDDDQPRDEDGRFASGGGGASKAKLLESAGSRFAINSIPAAVAQDNWNGVRQRMEKSLSEAGMTRGDHRAKDMFVATLPGGVLGAMNTEGTIAISPQTRDRAHEFYKEWDKDPEGVKDKLANLDVNDPEHVALVDKARGVHTIVHENIHAHGPLTADDWEGDGLAAEELTTEMASRVYMRDNFGHDITKAYEKSLTDRHNGSKAPPIEPPSYHPLVNNTLSAIQEHLPVDRDKAHDILEKASVAFKKDTPDKMLSPIGRYKTGPASHLARHIIDAHGDDKLKSADKLNRLTTSLLMQWKKGLT